MQTVQCGEFVMTDGVITKIPGQKFEPPSLPPDMRISNPPIRLAQNNPMGYHRESENVAQMNAIREHYYQKSARQQYNTLRRLYYIQEIRRTLSSWGRQIVSMISSRRDNSDSRS